MSDMLAKGAAWLAEKRHAHMSQTVTYIRGAASIELNATLGRSEFEEDDDSGTILRHEARDFLIRPEDLVIGGTETKPQVGDRIQAVDGETTLTFEVLSPGGQPPWRYCDSHRKTMRIHTKLISQ